MIRNLEDLADSLGTEPTVAAISRRIYKDTECGAWVAEEPAIETARRKVEYQVRFRDSVGGPLAVAWRRGGRGDWKAFTDPAAPEPLVEYLGGVRFGNGIRLPEELGSKMSEVREGTAAAGDTVAWSPRRSGGEHLGRVTVEEKTLKAGIAVGSIVEGSDADAETVRIAYPFTRGQFDEAVAAVEASADEIWNATHGPDGEELGARGPR